MKKLTKNQHLVFEALKKADTPQSAYDLLDKLRDEGLRAPLQIYRALDKLVDFDLVHRLESVNAFVACTDDDHHHHSRFCAFAICDICKTVSEFSDSTINAQLQIWAKQNSFETTSTALEIRGICNHCKSIQ